MKQRNSAETVDRMRKGVAWGMLVCGITYLFILAEELTPRGRLNDILDYITLGGVAVTLVITLTAIWPGIKHKLGGHLIGPKEPEGFISGAMLTSFQNGWIATTVSITMLLGVSAQLEPMDLPLKVYFTALFAIAVLSVSISFFWLTRDDDLESDEE